MCRFYFRLTVGQSYDRNRTVCGGLNITKCLDETISATFFLHLEPVNARFDNEAFVLMQRFVSQIACNKIPQS